MSTEQAVEEEVATTTTDNIEDLSVLEEASTESVELGAEEASTTPDEDDVEEKVEISLGDESLTSEEEEEKAPDWVRELRREYRETKKQNRELQKRLEEKEVAIEQKPTSLGPKPKLEDFDYDSDRFDAALDTWYTTKNQVEAERQKAKAESERQQAEWQQKLKSYDEAKASLGVPDYQDSEDLAMETFDQTQQSLILEAMDNPALAIYALGKRPEKAKELASIKNPVKFVAAMAKLESQLKVSKVKTKPAPEKTISGSSKNTGGLDSTLERLEAEALKTGDYTKVYRYERDLERKRKASS